MQKRYFLATPRWYSYGGMFESLFWALNLAKFYNLKLILTYPNVHFDCRYNYPAFLNQELKSFVCENVEIVGDYHSCISKLITFWINFSRRLRNLFFPYIYPEVPITSRINFSRSLRNVLPKKVRTKIKIQDKIFPNWIGFSGLGRGKDLQKQLKLNQPVYWEGVLKNPVQVNLNSEQEERAKPNLEKLGMQEGQSFVCLYVRDAGFEKLRSSGGFNIANADIKRFIKAVLTMIERGYYIVRMGDPTMVPLEIHEKFIDYVHTPVYSELMDLYLYRYCTSWLGTQGGGRLAPLFYNRPSVLVNVVELPLSGYCSKSDIFICKHIFSIEEGRFLSLREQLERLHELPPDNFNSEKYILSENTPEEINQVVLEWYEAFDNPDFDWNMPLQEKYHDLRQERTKDIFFDPVRNEWKNITVEQYQHLRPRLGKEFLENCWEYGDYLKKLTRKFKKEILREKH